MSFKAIWANNTPYSKFLLAVSIILTSAIVFTLLSAVMATGFFGVSMMQLETLLNDFDNPLSISILKFIQSLSTIGTFILPAFVLAWLFDGDTTGYLKLSRGTSLTSVILVFVLLIMAVPFINYLGELNSSLSLPSWLAGVENWMHDSEEKAAKLTEKFLEINSPGELLLALLMIAVLPALGEELMFRGIVQRIFSEWSQNKHTGVWASAILFSAMHMQFYGFIPRMLLGVMLGYLLVWSGTLWLPIIAHFINNASAVIFTYLFKHQLINVDADKIGTENDYTALFISILVTAALLWTIYQRERKLQPAERTE